MAGRSLRAPELVAGANSASKDGQPYLRKDGHELVFYSNRPGTLGGNDVYSTMRKNNSKPWSDPVNLGPSVNSASSETRPSLSCDGHTLYFGSNKPGGEGDSDHYQATR